MWQSYIEDHRSESPAQKEEKIGTALACNELLREIRASEKEQIRKEQDGQIKQQWKSISET